MDIPSWKAEFTKVVQDEEIAPVDEMVGCKDLLSCIINHGTKKALLPATPSSKHDGNMVFPEMMSKSKKRAGSSIAPNKTFSSTQEQPPSKRVKSIPGQSSRSIPASKALMEPASPQTEITNQPRKISSSTQETPVCDIPEVARSGMIPEQRRESQFEKCPRQGIVKKSSGLNIDLTLDYSDEENQSPITSAQTHASTSSSSQKSPTNAIREARLRHFGSDVRKPASKSTVQQSSYGASPNGYRDPQLSPLAKKPLPQGMKEEDFDGFFSD
ncbi:hypothetical protein EAF04_004631 [Stromatinia cepivora]|nr:hypothetical protein EAF04_004631 [Stromatinia cepivora]